MEKKEFIDTLSELFSPLGFKKKGNFWVKDGDMLTKMINLQKSQFSNSFYINYGYVIKSIPLEGSMMHIFSGFGSIEETENKRIKELLNLNNNIPDMDRINELKQLLTVKLIPKIQEIKTEEDLLNELKSRSNLNDVPLRVKKHFNLV